MLLHCNTFNVLLHHNTFDALLHCNTFDVLLHCNTFDVLLHCNTFNVLLHCSTFNMLLHCSTSDVLLHCNTLTCYYDANQIAVLSHLFYVPNLALADYFPLPKFMLKIKGHFFEYISVIQRACTSQLKSVPQRDFSHAFAELYQRCKRCVTKEGFYVKGKCERIPPSCNLFLI